MSRPPPRPPAQLQQQNWSAISPTSSFASSANAAPQRMAEAQNFNNASRNPPVPGPATSKSNSAFVNYNNNNNNNNRVSEAAAAVMISSAVNPTTIEYQLHPSSQNDPKYLKFQQALLSWINRHLRIDNISIKNLIVEMSDGKSLGLLMKRLTDNKPPLELVPTLSERSRRLNFQTIVRYCEQTLGLNPYVNLTDDHRNLGAARWSLEGLVASDIRSILCLLVDLSHHFRSPFPLPSDLSVAIVSSEKISGGSKAKTQKYQITGDETPFYTRDHFGANLSMSNLKVGSSQNLAASGGGSANSLNRIPKDAFDVLFDGTHQNELHQVYQTILKFVNQCMEPLGTPVTDLIEQMHDGVYLIILAGYLSNYFVPLARYNIGPETDEEKMDNIYFAFTLMESTGLVTDNWRASDIVRKDQKTILRVLYDLFQAYTVAQDD